MKVYRHTHFSTVTLGLVLFIGIQSVQAQSLDRIERERAMSMLNVVKSDLKNNYYDEQFHGMDVEARLSRLTRWVLAADKEGLRYGLRLPGSEIAPGHGDAHRCACLRELALHGLE